MAEKKKRLDAKGLVFELKYARYMNCVQYSNAPKTGRIGIMTA